MDSPGALVLLIHWGYKTTKSPVFIDPLSVFEWVVCYNLQYNIISDIFSVLLWETDSDCKQVWHRDESTCVSPLMFDSIAWAD